MEKNPPPTMVSPFLRRQGSAKNRFLPSSAARAVDVVMCTPTWPKSRQDEKIETKFHVPYTVKECALPLLVRSDNSVIPAQERMDVKSWVIALR
jgi:hypothetical protein